MPKPTAIEVHDARVARNRAAFETHTNDPVFLRAMAITMTEEGCDFGKGDWGRVNHPADPGGKTCAGVIQSVYDGYRKHRGLAARDVYTIDLSEIVEIYRQNYWRDSQASRLVSAGSDKLALAHFDCAVNSGLKQAGKCLQRAVGATPVDGVVGVLTISRVLSKVKPEDEMVTAYLQDRAHVLRLIVARRPASSIFMKGWLARLRWVARAVNVPIDPSFAEGAV